MTKSCGSCVNCEKYNGKWICENCEGGVGMPYDVTPPNDEACPNWTDDPAERDMALNALREFTEHYWAEEGGLA